MHTCHTEEKPACEHSFLSASWRMNVSAMEAVELANLLRALRKVAGHLGRNAPGVDYAGFSRPDATSIIVDPAEAMGSYPVPTEKTDRMVGEVVHEALLMIAWTQRVWRNLKPQFDESGGTGLVKLQKLVKTAEDIHADGMLDGSVLSRYLAVARSRAMALVWNLRTCTKSGSSFDALVLAWWAASFQEQGASPIHPRHEPIIPLLMDLTASLVRNKAEPGGVAARCDRRSALYRDAWRILEPLVRELPLIDKRLSWVDGPGHITEAMATPGVAVPSGRPAIDIDLIRDIEAELAAGTADITPLIRAAVGYDNPDVAPMSRWDYQIPARPMVDRNLAGRIGAIFRGYSDRERMMSRGLVSGRVDPRRLYRAPVTGRCFREHQTRPAMDWNVTLLCDASGSMRGARWRTVENTISTLYRALADYRGNLAAYAYFEMDGICMISSLIRDGQVLSVPPSGQTASGQAIIAAALFMPKSKRRRLLIHVTDGESNFGCQVTEGIAFCRTRGIHLVTIGCGCRDRDVMERQYGNAIEFLGSFRQLPQAIERLLRWTFMYDSKTPAATGGEMR